MHLDGDGSHASIGLRIELIRAGRQPDEIERSVVRRELLCGRAFLAGMDCRLTALTFLADDLTVNPPAGKLNGDLEG